MGVTVQVRDLDESVDTRLKSAAAAKGLSYSEFLRRELTLIAERLRIEERWAEVSKDHHDAIARSRETERAPFVATGVSRSEIVSALDEGRGES